MPYNLRSTARRAKSVKDETEDIPSCCICMDPMGTSQGGAVTSPPAFMCGHHTQFCQKCWLTTATRCSNAIFMFHGMSTYEERRAGKPFAGIQHQRHGEVSISLWQRCPLCRHPEPVFALSDQDSTPEFRELFHLLYTRLGWRGSYADYLRLRNALDPITHDTFLAIRSALTTQADEHAHALGAA